MTFRQILSADCYASGNGTHRYKVTYTGDWQNWELITAVDNQHWDNPTMNDLCIGHYGGYVNDVHENEDGTKTARVGVYYD